MSLTVSLIAVLIPLLFMGDVVGRLFHEFAVTLAVSIALSLVVSLTLTPMMSARMLKGHDVGAKGKTVGHPAHDDRQTGGRERMRAMSSMICHQTMPFPSLRPEMWILAEMPVLPETQVFSTASSPPMAAACTACSTTSR